ncbi:hypothetical protein D3C76_1738590 [compost metagenome]
MTSEDEGHLKVQCRVQALQQPTLNPGRGEVAGQIANVAPGKNERQGTLDLFGAC